MSKYTPGPWKAEKIRDAIPYNWAIRSVEDGLLIAEVEDWVDGRRDAGLGEPNARLIAAAPEMYAHIERFLTSPSGTPRCACADGPPGTCWYCEGRSLLDMIDDAV